MKTLETLGQNLRKARKQTFSADDMTTFALRLGISRATLQKMEAGELSVSFAHYYRAAELLNLTNGFDRLFELDESLFDD